MGLPPSVSGAAKLTVDAVSPAGTPPMVGGPGVLAGFAVYANTSAEVRALVPPIVVTLTSTVSTASPRGAYAVIMVSSLTTNPQGVSPKETVVAPVRLAPVMVTVVAWVSGPLEGLRAVTTGGATNVNWSAALDALGPPALETITCTVPAAIIGDTAVIDVSPFTLYVAAARVPKSTDVVALNPVPVMVTVVLPLEGPDEVDRPVTLGAGTKVGLRT